MTAPVIQVRDPLQESLQFAMQLFVQGRARRDAKAREALDLVPEGTTAGAAAEDEQLANIFKRGFGIDPAKLDPETVLKPATTQGELGRLLAAGRTEVAGQEGLPEALGATALAGLAGRPATGITTATGLAAETQGAQAAAQRSASIQIGARQAVEELKAEDPEGFKQFALGQVVEALPTEVAARSMSGQLKFIAAREGVRIATDKENPINKILAPLGISVGDAVGAVATGIDGMLRDMLQLATLGAESEARMSELLTAAEIRVAEDVSKAFGGRVPVKFVLGVMQGTEAASTPMGQELLKFMSAGITENFTKRVVAGDPGMTAIAQALPLMRLFERDPRSLAKISNMLGDALVEAYRQAGVDLEEVMPVLKQDRSWVARLLEWVTFGGIRLFPGGVKPERPKGRKQPEQPEPSAPLGRTGGAGALPPSGSLPVGTAADLAVLEGTGIQMTENERQVLEAYIQALQQALDTAAAPGQQQ